MWEAMLGKLAIGLLAAVLMVLSPAAWAGPWEDGMAAYNRGDYVPAIQVFRGMARAGNAKAQGMLGAMYRRGQGVAKSPARAFMWLTMAASRGDAKAKAELKTVSATMTAEEMTEAQAMMQACEASDYRTCEY
jgi:TPR repeat protein